MALGPVFKQPGGFAPTPAAAPVADKSAIGVAFAGVAAQAEQLGHVILRQEQKNDELKASLGIAKDFLELKQQASQAPNAEGLKTTMLDGIAAIENKAMAFGKSDHSRRIIGADLEQQGLRANAFTFSEYTKRITAEHRAMMTKKNELILQNSALDPNPDTTAAKAEISWNYKNGMEAGAFTQDGATRGALLEARKIDFNKARQWVRRDPSTALNLLAETKSEEDMQEGEGFAYFTALDPNQREVLIAQARQGLKIGEINVTTDGKRITDNIWNGGSAAPQQMEEFFRKPLTLKQRKKWSDEFKGAQTGYDQLQKIVAMPRAEGRAQFDAHVEEVLNRSDDPAFHLGLAKLRQEYSEFESRARLDPGLAGNLMSPVPLDPNASMEEKAQHSLNWQANYFGSASPRKPLSREAANSIVTALSNAPDSQRPEMVRAYVKASGKLRPEVLKQLYQDGNLPGEFEIMADTEATAAALDATSITWGKSFAELGAKYLSDIAQVGQIKKDFALEFEAGFGSTLPKSDTAQYQRFLEVGQRAAIFYGDAQKAYEVLYGENKTIPINGDRNGIRAPRSAKNDPGFGSEIKGGLWQVEREFDYDTVASNFPESFDEKAIKLALEENGSYLTLTNREGTEVGVMRTYRDRPLLVEDGKGGFKPLIYSFDMLRTDALFRFEVEKEEFAKKFLGRGTGSFTAGIKYPPSEDDPVPPPPPKPKIPIDPSTIVEAFEESVDWVGGFFKSSEPEIPEPGTIANNDRIP